MQKLYLNTAFYGYLIAIGHKKTRNIGADIPLSGCFEQEQSTTAGKDCQGLYLIVTIHNL